MHAVRKSEVKKLAKSNIFEAGAAEIPQLFADYIENEPQDGMCVVLAISSAPLGPLERNAIEKSLVALGFGEESCTYALLAPPSEDDAVRLDARALFLLVEGLDPLRIIAADAKTLDLLADAYRMTVAPDSAMRIFGRPSACFENLAVLLQTDAGKQKAWAVFKTLAR